VFVRVRASRLIGEYMRFGPPVFVNMCERRFPKPQVRCECLHSGAGVWVGAQLDPLVVFVFVVRELGWG